MTKLFRVCGFRLSVEVVDLAAVAVFDYAAAQFHGGGKSAVLGGEFVRDEENAFQLFESREILIGIFRDCFIKYLDLRVGDEFGARRESYVVFAGPVFQQREVRRDDDKSKLAFVANDGRVSDQGVEFQRVFNGLRSDELSARSFYEFFLAIGDGEISIGIDVADVAGFEPAIEKGVLSFRSEER